MTTGLGLKAYHGTGEFSPRLQYDARSGHYTRVDRTADGIGIIKAPVMQPVFAFDIGSIEIGWMNFNALVSVIVVPFGQPMPERPDRNHKAGFRSKIWDGREATAREFSATAGATVNAIEALWDQLSAAPEARAGMLPVIQAVTSVPVSTNRNTNFSPVFSVLQWIDRDDAVFGPRTVAAPGASPIVRPVQQASAPAPVPAPAAWPSAAPTTPAPIPAAWPTPDQKAP